MTQTTIGKRALVAFVIACAVFTAPLISNAGPEKSTAVTARQQEKRIQSLRRTASGIDPIAATAALRELKQLGTPARAALVDALRKALDRNGSILRRAGAASSAKTAEKLRSAMERVEETRKGALENIGKLDKGETLRKAREYYTTLMAMTQELNAACAQLDPVVRAVTRRPELLAMYREVDAAAAAKEFPEAAEETLLEGVEDALGVDEETLSKIPEFADDEDGPGDGAEPLARQLWFWRACRHIEAYNAAAGQELMGPGERSAVNFINAYREALGLMPLEVDPRLVESSRRHCREMAKLRYFAHESPTPANKSPADRARNAGYDGAFCGENLANGTGSGEATFWGWFGSPPHHKGMASRAPTALGVGQAGRLWALNTGKGPRLSLMSEEKLKGIKVKDQVAGK